MSHLFAQTPPQSGDAADHYLSRKEAARYLRDTYGDAAAIAPSTLAKLASIGGGPEFHRFGRRVGYTRPSLDAFVQSRTSGPLKHTSTPDYRAQTHAAVNPTTCAMEETPSASAWLG